MRSSFFQSPNYLIWSLLHLLWQNLSISYFRNILQYSYFIGFLLTKVKKILPCPNSPLERILFKAYYQGILQIFFLPEFWWFHYVYKHSSYYLYFLELVKHVLWYRMILIIFYVNLQRKSVLGMESWVSSSTENLDSIPSTHMGVHKNLQLQFSWIQHFLWPLWVPNIHVVHIYVDKILSITESKLK